MSADRDVSENLVAADMLTAYYSRGCDSRELFAGLEIAKDENFGGYLNKYDTIFLNIQEFLSRSSNVQELLTRIKQRVIRELTRQYPDVELFDSGRSGRDHAGYLCRK